MTAWLVGVAGLVLIEALLRWAARPGLLGRSHRMGRLERPMVYTPHHYLCYQLAPGYRSLDQKTVHDEHGFRGNRHPMKKATGVFRIVCIGASTTHTVRVRDDNDTYPARLEFHLQEMYPHVQVQVINAGVPGYTSAENFINLSLRALAWQPDLFVAYHAHNDLNPRLRPELRSDYTGYRRVWTGGGAALGGVFGASLLLRLLAARFGPRRNESILDVTTVPKDARFEAEAERRMETNTAAVFETNLLNMAFVAKGHGIPILLASGAYLMEIFPKDTHGGYFSAYRRGIEEHRQVARRVAERAGGHYLDFDSIMPKKRELFYDHCHVNEAGADVKGRLFAQAIRELGVIARPTEAIA